MRPGPGVESPVRPRRKSATDEGSPQQAVSAGPTAFFLASESDVEIRDSEDGKSDKMNSSMVGEDAVDEKESGVAKDSIFGVQSLADALEDAFAAKSEDIRPQTQKTIEGMTDDAHEATSAHAPAHPSIPGHMRTRSTTATSPTPLTPLQTMSPATGCWSGVLPSTPKSISLGSFRLSDTDSQAGQVDEDSGSKLFGHSSAGSGPPELVMPSLALPDRRPFTEKGKSMGRLRICVVGRKGMLNDLSTAMNNFDANTDRVWQIQLDKSYRPPMRRYSSGRSFHHLPNPSAAETLIKIQAKRVCSRRDSKHCGDICKHQSISVMVD